MPPPTNVLADALVKLIVPVPVTVKFVAVTALNAVPDVAIDHVPEPIAIVLVVVPETLYAAEPELLSVKLNPFASKVPCV